MSGSDLTITALLAAQPANAPALVYRGRSWSHGEIDDAARRAAAALRERGIGPGDRVALFLPNCPAYVILWLACARLSAIAVAVNTRYRSVEVGDIVRRTQAKALAIWPGFRGIDFAGILSRVEPDALAAVRTLIVYGESGEDEAAAPALPQAEVLPFDSLLQAPPMAEDLARPDSACNIFTTSGTTKAPKLVLHRQSVIAGHGRDVARAFGYDAPGTVMLQAIPLCGVFGLCQYAATLAAGAPSVMMAAFEAEEAAQLILAHGVTHSLGADDMVDRLLAAVDGPRPFPTLRQFGFAKFNAALTDIVERAEARGLTLCGLYGSSEVQALFSLQAPDAPAAQRKLGGGMPVSPAARIRARDRDTGAILPHGEAGELEISAPSLMTGYDGDPEATKAAFTEDGYFRSGDLGHTLADGGFVYLSRAGDALRLGGFLVNPAEIEAHLLSHPAVDGCQVVGVETAKGTAPAAFVTLKPGATADAEALRAHCKGALAAFKVPVRVFPVDGFPTTESANGTKIQRNRLRDMAQAALDRDDAAPAGG